MAQAPVRLKIAVAKYPHTEAERSGPMPIAGVDAVIVNVVPQIAADRRKYQALMPVVGDAPLPFSCKQNLPTIQALEPYACKQGLIPRRMSVEDLFVDPEKL